MLFKNCYSQIEYCLRNKTTACSNKHLIVEMSKHKEEDN